MLPYTERIFIFWTTNLYPEWNFGACWYTRANLHARQKKKSQQETSCAERRPVGRIVHLPRASSLGRLQKKNSIQGHIWLQALLLNIWASARWLYYVLNITYIYIYIFGGGGDKIILERSRLIHTPAEYSHPDLSQMLPACSHFVHSALRAAAAVVVATTTTLPLESDCAIHNVADQNTYRGLESVLCC